MKCRNVIWLRPLSDAILMFVSSKLLLMLWCMQHMQVSHVLSCTLQEQTALDITAPWFLRGRWRVGVDVSFTVAACFCTDTQSDFPPHKRAGVKNLSDKHSFFVVVFFDTSLVFCWIRASGFKVNRQHWSASKTKKKRKKKAWFPSWLCKDLLYILLQFFINPELVSFLCYIKPAGEFFLFFSFYEEKRLISLLEFKNLPDQHLNDSLCWQIKWISVRLSGSS